MPARATAAESFPRELVKPHQPAPISWKGWPTQLRMKADVASGVANRKR